MKGSIRVSEKHGVNPSLGLCFWCGEEDGTVLLLGRLPGDKEAPRRVCATREPCAKCAEHWAAGIVLMEAEQHHGDVEPTGRWLVLSEQGVRHIFQPESVVEEVLRKRKAYMDPQAFSKLAAAYEATQAAQAIEGQA